MFNDKLDIMFFKKKRALTDIFMHTKILIELALQEIFNHQNIVQKFCFLEKKVVFCKVSEKKIIHSDDILMYALF